jgi:hypothetical protein
MDPSVQAAWVAVVGTLVGSASGAGIQAWFSTRALIAARADSEAQRQDSREALDHQLSEERFARLWAERRGLFARLLQASHEWHLANVDLAGLRLSETDEGHIEMSRLTVAGARDALPEAAQALDCMYGFRGVAGEVHLLSDAEVRGAVENLGTVLRAEFRRAVAESVTDGLKVTEALELAQLAMRRELVHYK